MIYSAAEEKTSPLKLEQRANEVWNGPSARSFAPSPRPLFLPCAAGGSDGHLWPSEGLIFNFSMEIKWKRRIRTQLVSRRLS